MLYAGIDLGGTNIAVGLVDENGRVIIKDSVTTLRDREYPEIIRDMAMLTIKVVKDAGADLEDVRCIGVGSPGTPDSREGILVYNNNLNFRNVPIRTELQRYINLPVYLDNDANAAALAESVAGAAKGVEHSVTVTLGTGIGAGVIINRKIYSGFNNSAGEVGHMVIYIDGEQCTCGRRGCWEAYASATALIRQARMAVTGNPDSLILKLAGGDVSKIDAKLPFDAAKQGDETGKKVVDRYITYLAEGLCNVINAFQPEILVIGGGVSKQGEYLLKPLRKLVGSMAYSAGNIPQTQLKTAEMGNDAGIVGAAMLGR